MHSRKPALSNQSEIGPTVKQYEFYSWNVRWTDHQEKTHCEDNICEFAELITAKT